MRKSLLYIVSLLALVGACTSEEELDNAWIGPTCHDGIKNQDEEDIDCGGRCTECKVYIPVLSPCTSELRDNWLSLDDRDIQIAARDLSCNDDSGYTIGVLIDGRNSFVIKMGNYGKPLESASYTLVSTMRYLDEGQAAIQYDEEDEYGDVYSYTSINNSGKVYVNVTKDQKISVEFCDVTIKAVDYWGYEVDRLLVSGRLIGCK